MGLKFGAVNVYGEGAGRGFMSGMDNAGAALQEMFEDREVSLDE
jgi:hypothetical protein